MNVNIGKAKPEDAEDIQNVFKRTFISIYPNEKLGISTEDLIELTKDLTRQEKIDELRKSIENLKGNVLYLVADDSEINKVIGLCVAIKFQDFNQLKSIYILPEYQNQKIGKAFWAECSKFFDKNKKIIVQVADYNTQAIKFYEKLGFKDNSKRFTEERHRMPISGVLIPEMEMEILQNSEYFPKN